MAMRDNDTRPLRPASRLLRLDGPHFPLFNTPAKSLWVNDKGIVTVNMVAEKDDRPVTVNIYGPGCIPVRVKAIVAEGTTAKDILAMYD